ncbi:hypothetical protein AB0F17_43185 [Nonomuraea sp. NPDC026600]|uniref:hypothetical protein n=1 Tax=Nonomuraea sp. NPDC026600 TaxID=3155363 RepID=UPI0033CF63D2
MHPDAELWHAKHALGAAHRSVTHWGRFLRIAVRVPMATPLDIAHALAVRDAETRPLVAKLLDRYERAQGDLLAARINLTDRNR